MGKQRERQQLVGELTAKLEEGAPFCIEPEHPAREIEDGASGLAGAEAVPRAIVVGLEAGCPVVVQSGSDRGAYATEVKEHLEPRFPLSRTGYPVGTGNGGWRARLLGYLPGWRFQQQARPCVARSAIDLLLASLTGWTPMAVTRRGERQRMH